MTLAQYMNSQLDFISHGLNLYFVMKKLNVEKATRTIIFRSFLI